MSKNSGLRKACLYALPPHRRGYCGPEDKSSSSLISDFINSKKVDEEKVRSILDKKFIVSGYYRMIAQAHKLDLFDEKVIEAYWIGNKLLDRFFNTGKIIPFHLYHVIAVGSITGRIKFDDLKRDKCRISWGKILKKIGSRALVECRPLLRKNKMFSLGQPVVKKADWNKDFVSRLKIGDTVSIHWNKIIEVLDKKSIEHLQNYTRLTLKICTI